MIKKLILAGMYLTFLFCTSAFGQNAVEPSKKAFDSSAHMPAGSSMVMTADSLKNIQVPGLISGTNAGCLQKNEPGLFRMPIFKPDSSLTASMPVYNPPPVDEGMILPIGKPFNEQCE